MVHRHISDYRITVYSWIYIRIRHPVFVIQIIFVTWCVSYILKPGLYFERKSTPYTRTILRTWGAYSRPPMPINAVMIEQMPSINTPTTRRLLRWPLPAFWRSADLEMWMLDCHWLIARDLCVYACFYAAYNINPSPWNGTQTAIAYVCVNTRGDLRRSINHITCESA